jgi:hypothetical protein
MSDLSFKPRSADTSWSIGVLIYNYFCFVSQFQARGYMNKQNARIEMDSQYMLHQMIKPQLHRLIIII